MTFKLGSLFPKDPLNEPLLELNDSKWAKLEGGYKGTPYDASIALIKLQKTTSLQQTMPIYAELWEELHHQGDVGMASLYAVPHLVKISKEKGLVDWNVLGLVTLIEVQRKKSNLILPSKLKTAYEAIRDLGILAISVLSQSWGLDLASSALAAIALSKGQVKLANAILCLDSEDTIEEFLEAN